METQDKFKYTSDGRKVVVVGALNAKETIVQEVFIINGNEIPSGENFVVKSLHDAPAISWEEKRTKEIKDRYNETKQKYEKEEQAFSRNHANAIKDLKNKTSYLRKVIPSISVETFDRVAAFLQDKIHYVVTGTYSPSIEAFHARMMTDVYDGGGLKLLTLFGEDDGSMTFKINRYGDGSGGDTTIFPYETYEEAVAKLQEIIDNQKKYGENIFAMAAKHNLHLDQDKIAAYQQEKEKELFSLIEKKENEIKAYKEGLKKLKNL